MFENYHIPHLAAKRVWLIVHSYSHQNHYLLHVLCLDSTIRLALRALNIHIAVHVHVRSVLLHLLSPGPHVLQKYLDILFFAQVDRLFILAYLFYLGACYNFCETKVVLI